MRYTASGMVSGACCTHTHTHTHARTYARTHTHTATATFPCQRFSEEVLPKDEASTASGTLAVKLDSNDSLFSSMRDLNFRAVGGYLTVKAKDITALYEVCVCVCVCVCV